MNNPARSGDRPFKEFGEAIERERTRRGWSADEAARRAAVAPKTWQRLEDGLPVRNLTMLKVDRLFGLPPGTALQVWQERGDLEGALSRAHEQEPGPGPIPAPCHDETPTGRMDRILELLPTLSTEQLEVVITSVQATQRAKAAEQRRQLGLPEPDDLAAKLGFDNDTAPLPGPPDEPQGPDWTAFYAAQHAVWLYKESYDRAARAWHHVDQTRGSGHHAAAISEFETAVRAARDCAARLTKDVRAYLDQLSADDLAANTRFWRAKRKLDDAQREYRAAGQDINSALREMRGGSDPLASSSGD